MASSHKPLIPITEEILQTPISEMGLNLRLYGILDSHGLRTAQDLLYCCARKEVCPQCLERGYCDRVRLWDIPHVGKKYVKEIQESFVKKGWFRKVDDGDDSGS